MKKKTINLKEASFTQAINISAQWCKEWGEDLLSAIGEVIVIFSPINLFIKVDLPTFGLPSKVTNPDL